MRRPVLTIAFLGGLVATAAGDALVLNDGRKLVGRVVEKKDGFELTIEGQTLGFAKEDVKHWIKSPREIVGDADKLIEEAKKLYSEAVEIKDDKAAEAKFREALPKVQKARDAYAEARDLFPDGHPELDSQLVNVMKLMRLVRERIGSQLASASAAPVKTKDAPPPKAAPPPAAGSKPEPPPPAPEPKPEPAPAPSFSMGDALAIMVDPSRRADEKQRSQARSLFRKATEARGPLSDVATAGFLFLSRTDKEWKFSEKSESLGALQSFFKGLGAEKLETLSDKELNEGVKFLAMKVKELRGKADPAVDAVSLFVAGPASALIDKNGGKTTPELEAAFKDLGFEKSEFGAVWGRKDGLAMDDYRKWLMSGEYGLAIVQFWNDYRNVTEFNVRYALGLLMIFKALQDNRSYNKAAAHFEALANSVSSAQVRDHCAALAKSIRTESPCPVCGGTRKINCSACKGKTRVNLECNKCGGSGQINTMRGVAQCPGCKGQGRFNNVECPKCKAAGKTDCKARGCTREVSAPTFESFAEAFQCQLCKGKGTLMRHVAYACPDCQGLGLILQPRADPTKLLK